MENNEEVKKEEEKQEKKKGFFRSIVDGIKDSAEPVLEAGQYILSRSTLTNGEIESDLSQIRKTMIISGIEKMFAVTDFGSGSRDYNNYILELKCDPRFLNRPKEVVMSIKHPIYDEKGIVIDYQDTIKNYFIRENYPLRIEEMGLTLFCTREEAYNFLECYDGDPFKVKIHYHLGNMMKSPFAGVGILNLSDSDYYTVMNGKKVKLPKGDKEKFKHLIASNKLEEKTKDYDVLVCMNISNEYMTKKRVSIKDNVLDNLEYDRDKEHFSFQFYFIKKSERSNEEPHILQKNIGMPLFGNEKSCDEFINSEFKGDLINYLIIMSLKIAKKKAKKYYEKESAATNNFIQGLFLLAFGSQLFSKFFPVIAKSITPFIKSTAKILQKFLSARLGVALK